MEALIKYEDYLIKTRGKIELRIGDVLIKPDVRTSEIHPQDPSKEMYIREEGRFLCKTLIDTKHKLDLFNRLIGYAKKRGENFLEGYWVEIKYPEIKWDYIDKTSVRGIIGGLDAISLYQQPNQLWTLNDMSGGERFEGTLEECKQEANKLLWKM